MRESRNWSQEELAALVGMPQTAISRLESPDYGKPTITTLKRMARVYDVGLDVRFVPFSLLVDRMSKTPRLDMGLTSDSVDVPSFEEERPYLNNETVLPNPPLVVGQAQLVPLSGLLNLNRVEIAPLQVAFAGQINTAFDRYSQLAGGGDILTGNFQTQTVTAQIATDLVAGNHYQEVPLSLVVAEKALSQQLLTGAENGG
jgi:transcriptional regulator with XRE-family HTH domain